MRRERDDHRDTSTRTLSVNNDNQETMTSLNRNKIDVLTRKLLHNPPSEQRRKQSPVTCTASCWTDSVQHSMRVADCTWRKYRTFLKLLKWIIL